MATPHEAIKPKIPEMHFKPEGYVSSGSDEFLEAFLDELKTNGYETKDLVFSGFDGTDVASGEEVPRHPYIFAMDVAGWRTANRRVVENPATYAEGWKIPCIGLYDKNQLAEVYYGVTEQDLEDLNSRIELSDISLGRRLNELPPGTVVEEAVAHVNFPDASPTDALVGLVFLDN
jgi:hypothetical protein